MKPIPGYEGLYSATDEGEIYSHKRDSVRKTFEMNNGYLMLTLNKDRRKHSHTVHKLVALAHLGPRPAGDVQVNHIDGDKHNNRPSNLEYVSRSENCKHAVKMGLSKVPFKRSDVFVFKVIGRLAMGLQVRQVAESLGVANATVCRIKNGHTYSDLTGIKRKAAS